jgi:hypothetical protein
MDIVNASSGYVKTENMLPVPYRAQAFKSNFWG